MDIPDARIGTKALHRNARHLIAPRIGNKKKTTQRDLGFPVLPGFFFPRSQRSPVPAVLAALLHQSQCCHALVTRGRLAFCSQTTPHPWTLARDPTSPRGTSVRRDSSSNTVCRRRVFFLWWIIRIGCAWTRHKWYL